MSAFYYHDPWSLMTLQQSCLAPKNHSVYLLWLRVAMTSEQTVKSSWKLPPKGPGAVEFPWLLSPMSETTSFFRTLFFYSLHESWPRPVWTPITQWSQATVSGLWWLMIAVSPAQLSLMRGIHGSSLAPRGTSHSARSHHCWSAPTSVKHRECQAILLWDENACKRK